MTIDHRHSAIELHIDELTLQGFPMLDHHSLDAAVRTELTRLLSEYGAPPPLHHASEIAALPGGTIMAVPSADAATLGAQIAQAVYGGLSR